MAWKFILDSGRYTKSVESQSKVKGEELVSELGHLPIEFSDSPVAPNVEGLIEMPSLESLSGTEPQHSPHSGVSDIAGSVESHREVNSEELALETEPLLVDSGVYPAAKDSEGSRKMPHLENANEIESPHSHYSGVSDGRGSVKSTGELKGEESLVETDRNIEPADVQSSGNASEELSRSRAGHEWARYSTGDNILGGASPTQSSELAKEEDTTGNIVADRDDVGCNQSSSAEKSPESSSSSGKNPDTSPSSGSSTAG